MKFTPKRMKHFGQLTLTKNFQNKPVFFHKTFTTFLTLEILTSTLRFHVADFCVYIYLDHESPIPYSTTTTKPLNNFSTQQLNSSTLMRFKPVLPHAHFHEQRNLGLKSTFHFGFYEF